ncbi:MAG: hypothetical protein U0359_40320 [Byssovorax sp.]
MSAWPRRALLALLVATSLSACRSDPPPPPIRKLAPRLTERLGRSEGRRPEQERRFKEAGVYLDGKPLGVLRHSELPPSLPRRSQRLEDGREVPRFRLLEYLAALGAPVDRLKAAHFLGGRGRASIVAGDELRKHPETLLFSFSRGDSGKPRVHWPPEGIAVNTTIDTIAGILLYADKEPPAFDRKDHSFSLDGGAPIDGIPYAQGEEPLKGTRVYVDGVLAASMRRRTLPAGLLQPGSKEDDPRYWLGGWVASLDGGAAPSAVELIAGDEVVTRLSASQWAEEQKDLWFSLPRRSQGKMRVLLPPGDPAVFAAAPGTIKDPSVKVTAIQVYVKTQPAGGAIRPLGEILAEGDGSMDDQGERKKRGDGGGSGAARSLQSDEGE